MAGGICAIYNCYNYTISNCSKSFFRFPKDRESCQQWVLKCQREDLDKIFKKFGPEYLNKNFRVCSDHFSTSNFRNPNLPAQGLIKGSVPSVNLFKQNPSKPHRASPKKRRLMEDEPLQQDEDVINAETDMPVPVPDARMPKRFREDPETKIKRLQAKLLQQHKTTSRLRQSIRKLKGDVSALVKQCQHFKSKRHCVTV